MDGNTEKPTDMRTCSKCGVGPLFNLGLEIPGPVLCSKCIREAGETPVDLQSTKLEDGDYIVTDFSDARVYEVCSKLMTPRAAEPSARKRLFWYTPKNAEKPHAFEFADDLPRFQTSESGQQAPNAGIRHDQDKLAWNLVPMEHLEGMVRVLMFGAKKYRAILAPKLKPWGVSVVAKTGPLKPEDFATAVMSEVACLTIQGSWSESESTSSNIRSRIESAFLSTTSQGSLSDKRIQSTKQSEETHTIERSMDSLPKRWTKPNAGLAEFVAKGRPLCTQTIVMQLDGCEVSFAVSAITGLDSSTTTLACLERLLNISLPASEYIATGTHNWRKGLHYSRVTNSLQRHLNEFNAGNDIDEETGLRHVDHILCNALFLSGITKEHPEMDDRFGSDDSK